MPDAAVFFGIGGGEAVDTAAKIVRRYWALVGQPQRTVIVSRSHAYHGTNAYGTSLSGIPASATATGCSSAMSPRCPTTTPARSRLASTRSASRAAAFIGEPMIGAGGAIPPPDGYWPAVERICRERGVLLIADEVISGFGRLGSWFGCQRYGFTPDLMTCAKGISSGYVPLGAVIVSGTVRAPFWDEAAPPFLQGGTYSGHPAACVAGLANLDIIEREGLVERVAALEPVLRDLLEPLADARRRRGGPQRRARRCGRARRRPARARPAAPADGMLAARRHGVITRVLRGVALQISPPFVVTEDELAAIVDGIAAGVREAVADS